MNRHSPLKAEAAVSDSLKLVTAAAERDAFLSLARTQKRLSWVARGWARDAEERGDRAGYRSGN